MRCVTRVLLAASTTPEPMASMPFFLQGVVAHAMAMLADEGEFPLGLGPVRRSGGIAKVAQPV